jgi:hypothetical protein
MADFMPEDEETYHQNHIRPGQRFNPKGRYAILAHPTMS